MYGIENFMDWFDRKVETFKGRWKDAVSSDEFANADFFGKVKIVWDKIIAEPFRDWWQGSGKKKVAGVAGDIGSFLGTAIKTGILALFGVNISDALDEGVSVGRSFAAGFTEGLDFKAISSAFAAHLGDMIGNVAKVFTGNGDASTLISALILSRYASPLLSAGKTLFGKGASGTSLVSGILGSASAGSGLLGFGTKTAIKLGAWNLPGGFSLGAGSLSALGLGATAGGVIGAGTLISGGLDIYRATKAQSQDEKDMYKYTAAMKIGGVGTGAAIGALVGGPIGALIGAGIGGLVGLFGANKRKEAYEEAQEQARLAAAAQDLLVSKTLLTSTSLDKVKFSTEALNDALYDTDVTAEDFAKMLTTAVSGRIKDAFGSISLSLQEIKDMADSIVFSDMAEEAERFNEAISTASKALGDVNDDVTALEKLNWKASLGFAFTSADVESYKTAVDNFVKDAQTYLTDKHYEATLALRLITGGNSDTTGLDAVYDALKEALSSKSGELAEAVQRALADGVISTEPVTLPDGTLQLSEYEEITSLQNQISEILGKVTAAEESARLDTLQIKYGGASLSAESFTQLQSELAANVASMTANYDEALNVSLTNLHLQLAEGAISDEEFQMQLATLRESYRQQISDMNFRVEMFQLDTIAEAYGDALDGILPQLEGTTSEKLRQVLDTMLAVKPDSAAWTASEILIKARLNTLRQSHTTYELEEIIKETFVNEPDDFLLSRFVLALAFSNQRNFPPVRLDGSRLLDGSWLLNAAPSSMFGFPRFTVLSRTPGLRDTLARAGVSYAAALFPRAGRLTLPAFRIRTRTAERKPVFSFPRLRVGGGMERNRQSLGRAALTTDTMWRLDGSVPLDGSRRLNAEIRQEDI